MTIKAGQVYQAKALRGTRLIKIEQVRGLNEGAAAYVLAREILPSGKHATGWLRGVPRDGQMVIRLIFNRQGEAQMPPWYTLHEEEASHA